MGKIYEFKGYLMKYYGKYSRYVDKALQFILALLVFTYISRNVGFSTIVSHPVMTIILSVICMLLPLQMTVIFASVAIVLQIWTVSLGMAIVALAIFFILYAFYFRYAADKTIIILLILAAFMFDVPIVIPIIFGLLGSPICILPVSAGTIVHYMVTYVKTNATMLQSAGETSVFKQSIGYAQQLLMNPEMWCIIIAFAISLLLVYGVRRMSVDHSWEIAVIAGALGNINVMAYGYIIMDIPISYISLIVGSVTAVMASLIVKLFAFSVDYTRTEYLQFEDDEYYYYLKAVPKVSVAVPEKTMKRIHERQKTGVIDVEQVNELEKLIEAEQESEKKSEESEIQKIIDEELKQEK